MRVAPSTVLLTMLVAVGGCDSRTLSESDCVSIKERLQRAWHRDAVAAVRLSDRDGLGQFVRDEGARIGTSWMGVCRPLVGRPISSAQLACLAKADTIDDVYECAPR